jgi:tetratricopeptide (TPR) repeat protein
MRRPFSHPTAKSALGWGTHSGNGIRATKAGPPVPIEPFSNLQYLLYNRVARVEARMIQSLLEDDPKRVDRYRMLMRLQAGAAIALIFVVLYSIQFYGAGAVIRVASVGVLIAGASLFGGFLLGFIFCIPRTTKPAEAIAASSSGSAVGKDDNEPNRQSAAIALSGVETNTNLVEISDWLTKILVGVGLVELTKIPHSLHALCEFLGPGLRANDSPLAASSSESFALGIILFFFGVGFLIGYLWTRLYFQRALTEMADLASRIDRAWLDAEGAELLINEGRLEEALRVVDNALEVNRFNGKALVVKGRILKRLALAGGKPGDRSLLQEALTYAARAAEIMPNKGAPLYNMACYQALLGFDRKEILKNLERAIQTRPTYRKAAREDEDFADIREAPEFKELTKDPEKT